MNSKRGARSLLIAVWRRHNGENNGEISFSVREAEKIVDCHRNTASGWFHELVAQGILVAVKKGSFDWKKSDATTWRITALPAPGMAATREFANKKRIKKKKHRKEKSRSQNLCKPVTKLVQLDDA